LPAVPVLLVVDDVAPVCAPVLPVPCSALVGPQLVRLDSFELLAPELDEPDPELPEPELPEPELPEPELPEPELPELPELESEPEPELPEPEDCAMADVARPSERAVMARILVIKGFPPVGCYGHLTFAIDHSS
jgi:hypothetical protein